jgi:spermidine synthase
MARTEKLIYSGTSNHARYDIVDMIYDDRPARVLFSGNKVAAQSGLALDDKSDLLFDYNQRFMEVAASLRPKKVLLIGGGAFTLPMALLSTYPKLQIDVVELDPMLQELAEDYFGLKVDKRIRIINGDGRKFIDQSTDKYDLIVLDAFTHTVIPSTLTSTEAIKSFSNHLNNENSAVAVNIISSYYGRNSGLIRDQYEIYKKTFKSVEIFPASRSLLSFWLPQNFVLVARVKPKPKLELRYDVLDPPIS